MFLGEGQQLALTNGSDELMSGIAMAAPDARSTDGLVRRFRGGLPPKALRTILEYIDAHLGGTITVETLASVAGLSPYHFCRVFKQSKGVSPHGYLVHRRVDRAKELIAGTDLSLAEIALIAGFSDQSHCSRSFRRQLGISPSEYRWSTR